MGLTMSIRVAQQVWFFIEFDKKLCRLSQRLLPSPND